MLLNQGFLAKVTLIYYSHSIETGILLSLVGQVIRRSIYLKGGIFRGD